MHICVLQDDTKNKFNLCYIDNKCKITRLCNCNHRNEEKANSCKIAKRKVKKYGVKHKQKSLKDFIQENGVTPDIKEISSYIQNIKKELEKLKNNKMFSINRTFILNQLNSIEKVLK